MKHALIFASLLSLAPSLALADDTTEARQLFDAGQQAYSAGLYLDAARAFGQAYDLVKNPAITFSMAQCYRLQYFVDAKPEHLQEAISLYRRYIQEVPKGGRREDAVTHLAGLEPMASGLKPVVRDGRGAPTQLMVSSRTPGAKARIDGSEPAEVPVIRDVQAGDHLVFVEAAGFDSEGVKAVAVAGRLVVAEVNLKEKPAKLTISAPDDSDITIDGRPMGVTPLARPLDIPAGKHVVAITQVGRVPFSQEVVVERGQDASLVANLDTTTQRDFAYGCLGAGGALLLTSGATFLIGLGAEGGARFLLEQRDSNMNNLSIKERDDYNDLRAARTRLYATSTGTLIGGVVIMGIGGLLYFLDNPKGTQVTFGSGVTPMVDESGTVGLGYTGTY
jgi:hypothetical protein